MIKIKQTVLAIISVVLALECTRNIQPLPDSVALAPSLSFPVGEGSFNLAKTYITLGLQEINLTENVPEWAKYRYVYVQDTFALNLTEAYNQSEDISIISFRVNIWNDFPLQGDAQVLFVSSSYQAIDSLFSPNPATVRAAEIYSNGDVVGTKFESYPVQIDKQRIDNLSQAQYVVVRAGLVVTEEGINELNVQYFDRYKLRVQIAARVDFSLNISN